MIITNKQQSIFVETVEQLDGAIEARSVYICQVTLLEARNLPVWGFPWQSNPYCRLEVCKLLQPISGQQLCLPSTLKLSAR